MMTLSRGGGILPPHAALIPEHGFQRLVAMQRLYEKDSTRRLTRLSGRQWRLISRRTVAWLAAFMHGWALPPEVHFVPNFMRQSKGEALHGRNPG